MVAPARPELQYQPNSSLVQCNAGERVLLRFVNLGFQQHAMRADGLTLRVVGRDARFLGPRAYDTDTILVAPGESYDVIFTAPAVAGPTTYLLYNRSFKRSDNQSSDTVVAIPCNSSWFSHFCSASLRRSSSRNGTMLPRQQTPHWWQSHLSSDGSVTMGRDTSCDEGLRNAAWKSKIAYD